MVLSSAPCPLRNGGIGRAGVGVGATGGPRSGWRPVTEAWSRVFARRVGEQYLLTCCRYIELNPVRAGMVARPGDCRRSSWPAHAEAAAGGVVGDHPILVALGDTAMARRQAYRDLFRDALPDTTVSAIRHATNTAWPLGGERFTAELAALTARRVTPAPAGRPRAQAPDHRDQGALTL